MSDYKINNYVDLDEQDTLDNTGLEPLDVTTTKLESKASVSNKIDTTIVSTSSINSTNPNNPINPSSSDNSSNSINSIDYRELFSFFAELGRQLDQTYSEGNQETSEGFISGLDGLAKWEKIFQEMNLSEHNDISVVQRDGFLNFIKYLRVKLERRAGQADKSAVNM